MSEIACFMVEPAEIEKLRKTPRQGSKSLIGTLTPGAMFDAPWYRGIGNMTGPDGLSLMVMTPGGLWCIDGPATDGGRWSRTGTPPNVTVSPSINIEGAYHGWLRNGVLVDA